MLRLSFDSRSTKQQYSSLTVVPAESAAAPKKTVEESVDDSVHKAPRLAAVPQKEEPRQALA
jgi:hypothetical protein